MYASGDVENPDVDTIDYMEDLVVDWLADLVSYLLLAETIADSSAHHLPPFERTLLLPSLLPD
jgi:hypothetical protein